MLGKYFRYFMKVMVIYLLFRNVQGTILVLVLGWGALKDEIVDCR